MRRIIIAVSMALVIVGVALSAARYFSGLKNGGDATDRTPIAGSADLVNKKGLNELVLTRLSDSAVVKLDTLKGKVHLVTFWASWCEACMAEMPSIQALYARYHTQGFDVVAINVDDEPEKVAPRIIKKFNLEFNIYTDRDESVSEFFNVVAIPFNVVLDKNLKVAWSESGERDWMSNESQAEIQKLLSGAINN